MKRRNFIKNSVGAAIAGPAVINGLYMNRLFAGPDGQLPVIDIPSPHLNRLIVKPIMTQMYHTDEWEGPCRFNVVPMEEEKRRALNSFDNFTQRIGKNDFNIDKGNVEMLEPGLILFVEDFRITDEEYAKIDSDARKADVLFIDPSGASIATFRIAKRYNKPVVFPWNLNCRTVDIAAYCRSNGIEAFIPDPETEVNEILALLRARKVFKNTRILYPTDWGWPSVASVAGINEPEKLKEMYGIELVKIPYAELIAEMEQNLQSQNVLSEAAEMADVVYENSERNFLDKKYVNSSMVFYQTVIETMKKHHCNAFTIECFEFCASRLPQKWNITPCLIHTLFKDLGIPSACEGDLGGLLAMHLLMSVSKRSAHMGNMFYREDGIMEINHSVPGIKMNGWDKPGLPYQLGRFVESGWGTKAVVDFMNNNEKMVTVARVNPTGDGLLLLKGELVNSKGWDEDLRGCSVSAFIVGKESGTAHEFMKKQADYGNHLCWVYGDYTPQLEKLGQLLGIRVVTVS
jgi:L-fucose isomerase-like protein